MKRPLFLVLAGLAFLVSACSSNGDDSPTIGGAYGGSYTSLDGYEGTISLALSPGTITNESVFSWSLTGMVVDDDGFDRTVSLSGAGEYVYPNIAFMAPGRTLTGTVTNDGASISASLPAEQGVEAFDVTR